MINAITNSKEKIYAFDTDVIKLKKLSELNLLRCPYCNKVVKYRSGGKKSPHFTHLPNNNCFSKGGTNYSNSVNDSSKRIKGNKLNSIRTNLCNTCGFEFKIEYIRGKGYVSKCHCNKDKPIEQPLCPTCGTKMFLRKNSKDNKYFWGCGKYPQCKGTKEFISR